MKKHADPESQREHLRNSIIGLGERSIRKSYYPELQKRIAELEKVNKELLSEIKERQQAQAFQKKLEDQLRQAQKMEAIGTLAGGIAHDFNNILTSIIGYAELISLSLDSKTVIEKSVIQRDIKQILQAGIRAKELVNQILAFSKQQDHQAQPLQINAVIHEVLNLLRSSIPKSVEIRENIVDHDTLVFADPSEIHQVVMNLCTNAYQAMRDNGGILAVELFHREIDYDDDKISDLHLPPGSYLLLKISDTGVGMQRALLNRIFDPYFTTKKLREGTGLGLAVVHGIVKNCNGHITVYSEPGNGSSFHVYWPRITQEESVYKTPVQEDVPTGSERILIIDDEPAIIRMERRLVESLGYKVTSMTSPLKALQLLSVQPDLCDLVLTDMTMPKMNGAELAQKIIKIRTDMPVILCTGFSELINEDKARAIGIREYIMKPMIRREIALAIRRSLDS